MAKKNLEKSEYNEWISNIKLKVHNARTQITNFKSTLTEKQANLAINILKNPFSLELGKDFTFIGKKYKIQISETDYFIDLLFYHIELRCFVVVELKSGKFKPEFAGKLNFYLSAVDSQLKKENDNPSIGILLCKKKDKIEVEYALRDINKPLGVSEYRLTETIPDKIKTQLPSIEDLESNLTEKLKNGNGNGNCDE